MTFKLGLDEKKRLCEEIESTFNMIRGVLTKLERKNKSSKEHVSARNIYISMRIIDKMIEALDKNGLAENGTEQKK